jgi:hypothetical protein
VTNFGAIETYASSDGVVIPEIPDLIPETVLPPGLGSAFGVVAVGGVDVDMGDKLPMGTAALARVNNWGRIEGSVRLASGSRHSAERQRAHGRPEPRRIEACGLRRAVVGVRRAPRSASSPSSSRPSPFIEYGEGQIFA